MSRFAEVLSPCKFILSGEHAVVHGKHAVAVAVDLYTRVRASLVDSDLGRRNVDDIVSDAESIEECTIELRNMNSHRHSIKMKDLEVLRQKILESCCAREGVFEMCEDINSALLACCTSDEFSSPETFSEAVFAFLLAAISASNPDSHLRVCSGVSVVVSGGVPIGAGLGSSASFCVGIALALLDLAGVDAARDVVNRWAFQAERIVHGNPSGIDNSVVTYGGAVLYRKGTDLVPLKRLPQIPILIVNTNVPRSTKALVSSVMRFSEEFPSIATCMFDAIDAVALEMTEMLKNDEDDIDLIRLGRLIDVNQQLLKGLGVSHTSIDRVVSLCSSFGVHAKLTGAGGGGCVVAIPPADIEEPKLKQLIAELKLGSFQVLCARLTTSGAFVATQDEKRM